jgi:hypothetical protein
MSFKNTLARILTVLNGGTPPNPPVLVTRSTPESNDSKELLALKWEKIVRENN